MQVTDIPNFEHLTDLERLQLAEDLVASLRNPEALPTPVAHRLEVERRWAEYERDPSIAISQEAFWAKVQALKR
jgi:putative addiction module component (TIGR02574 family)